MPRTGLSTDVCVDFRVVSPSTDVWQTVGGRTAPLPLRTGAHRCAQCCVRCFCAFCGFFGGVFLSLRRVEALVLCAVGVCSLLSGVGCARSDVPVGIFLCVVIDTCFRALHLCLKKVRTTTLPSLPATALCCDNICVCVSVCLYLSLSSLMCVCLCDVFTYHLVDVWVLNPRFPPPFFPSGSQRCCRCLLRFRVCR